MAMSVSHVVRVYAGSDRMPRITVNSPTLERSLALAHESALKSTRGIEFPRYEIEEVEIDLPVHGKHHKYPVELPALLTQCHTLC